MPFGSSPHSLHVFPSAVSVTEIGCFAPVQCAVSASVSLSAGLHTLKNGSTDTSGTAGGRNANATIGIAARTATSALFPDFFMPYIPFRYSAPPFFFASFWSLSASFSFSTALTRST